MPEPMPELSDTLIAIEIDSKETWDMLCALQPHFKELDYEFNRGFFVVVQTDDPRLENSIMSPATVVEFFGGHIEPNDHRIKTVKLVKDK